MKRKKWNQEKFNIVIEGSKGTAPMGWEKAMRNAHYTPQNRTLL